MLTVAKFGGSSLGDSARFLQVAELIRQDPSRQVVVVSAAGRRHRDDTKITDLLYACHGRLAAGTDCRSLFDRVRRRYLEIRDGCGLQLALEPILDETEERLGESAAYAASRGEYLSALLMAELVGYRFLDSARWLRFGTDGTVDEAISCSTLRQLTGGQPVVLPGFYGADVHGQICTFSRGGSDVTGSLAAAWLQADLYENWTDVPGVFSADPMVCPQAEPLPRMTYAQLWERAKNGLQVFHADAVAPVWRAGIPLRICSTRAPQLPGTWVFSAEKGG